MINRLCDWGRELLIAFYRLQMDCIDADERNYWLWKLREAMEKRKV